MWLHIFQWKRKEAKYSSCFPPALFFYAEGVSAPVLQCFGASLAGLSCCRKGTVCRALSYPGVCSFLHASDRGDKRRGHRELFPQHSSAMTSDPDSLPSPYCTGQPGTGGAPLALAFTFVCVGSSLPPALGTGCALWTPVSREACTSDVLCLSEELIFYITSSCPSVRTEKSSGRRKRLGKCPAIQCARWSRKTAPCGSALAEVW